MKTHFFALTLMTTLVATPVFAQHSDVEFGYDDLVNPTVLEIEVGESTITGLPFFEAEFEELDPTGAPDDFSAEDPGFATAPDEGLNANTGDQIFVEILDASGSALFGGLGYSTFYNPAANALEAGGDFVVTGNSTAFDPLQIENGGVAGGNALQFVDTVENNINLLTGETIAFDEHIIFDLLDDTTLGAYGFLLRLHSNFAGTTVEDGFELTSDPFLVILNNQLSEDDFENLAVPAFTGISPATVPEPGTFALLAAGMSGVLLRRRRS